MAKKIIIEDEWYNGDPKRKRVRIGYLKHAIYCHLIYKPRRRVRFTVPYPLVRRLSEFLSLAESRGLTMERNDHPLALEIFFTFTSRHYLEEEDIKKIIEALHIILVDFGFSPEIIGYLDCGHELTYITEPELPDFDLRYMRLYYTRWYTVKEQYRSFWYENLFRLVRLVLDMGISIYMG